MKLGLRAKAAAAGVAFSMACAAHGAMVWDERDDAFGDFADEDQRLAPTPVLMGLGVNTIIGTTGNPGTGVDRDYFTFTVPDSALLSSIVVLDNTFVSGGSGFIAFQAGSQFTVDLNGTGGTMLGFLHYDGGHVGRDLLQVLELGSLPSGAYSVWVQETGGPTEYGFDFNITSVGEVPLPAAVLLLASGLVGLVSLRRLTADFS